MTQSFWKIPQVENLRVPIQIMREQAYELTRITQNVLRGKADSNRYGDGLQLSFSIIAPRLDDYAVEIFTYTQPIQIYPGHLESAITRQHVQINDINQFENALQALLSSDEIQTIVAALLAQSQ